MSEQAIPTTRGKLFRGSSLPNGLVQLITILIFTHLSALIMNQSAAYWLDPQYASMNLPFSFLLAGGPWLFLFVAGLYIIVVNRLLARLQVIPGLFLVGILTLTHSFSLYESTMCGFHPLYTSQTAGACYTYRYSLLIGFSALFALMLLVERLPQNLLHWGKKSALGFSLFWILILAYGIFRAAFPPPSPWKPVAPEHSPGPRTLAAVAYDSYRQRAVLFGGFSIWDGNDWVYDNSTWEWDGQDWQKIETPIAPAGRVRHAMVYDEVRGKVLLYGGQNRSGILADLWEWDGSTWHRLCPVCNPAARFSHQMVFDTARQQVLMYGGADGKKLFPEGWTWDGKGWTYLSFESSAPALYNAFLVYDPQREQAMSFLGTEWGGTWVWEDLTWRKLNLAVQPPLREDATLVYDPVHHESVLFGGIDNGTLQFNDTWTFDGKNWRELNVPRTPPQRSKAVAFYDPIRRSVIVYGGEGTGGVYSDMWELTLSEGNQP
jgi:hypothetical protein